MFHFGQPFRAAVYTERVWVGCVETYNVGDAWQEVLKKKTQNKRAKAEYYYNSTCSNLTLQAQ